MRRAELRRKTRETDIALSLNLEGTGKIKIDTGVGFFDHMLTALANHAGFDLELTCKGDLEVDCHHTIEDVGIALGDALCRALGDRRGIERFAVAFVPMDESLARCVLDLSGRGMLVYDAKFDNQYCGTMETCMAEEFFRALADNAKMTLHLANLYGRNDHHKLEGMFKATARALKCAVSVTSDRLPSTKGVL